jgi:ribosomal protein S18 acetylase RimI-like enzyme
MHIRPFQPQDESAVINLWQRCDLVRPQNDPHKDIARKRAFQPDLFLLALENDTIIGTIMIGYEGHRGWINYLAVDPQKRLQGIGRQLMNEAEQLLRARGCPKINLQVRTTNKEVLAFYRALGYAVDDVISLGKRLEQD